MHTPMRWWRRIAGSPPARKPSANAVKSLLAALRSPDVETRQRAVQALGDIGDAEALRALIGALADRDRSVGGAAARVLGARGSTDAIDPLRVCLTSLGLPAAEALQELGWSPTTAADRTIAMVVRQAVDPTPPVAGAEEPVDIDRLSAIVRGEAQGVISSAPYPTAIGPSLAMQLAAVQILGTTANRAALGFLKTAYRLEEHTRYVDGWNEQTGERFGAVETYDEYSGVGGPLGIRLHNTRGAANSKEHEIFNAAIAALEASIAEDAPPNDKGV